MAGHYFYDPRPYYGLNQSTNLMPLNELFYKYEPVPYWMDQRMAPMSYPDSHPGHVKQVMTRVPEVQQFLPYNGPELAVRDDIYTDIYKRSPHFNSFAPYPQPRGVSQDDTWVHTMAPQYANPQNQFPQQAMLPHRGYGTMADMPMPRQMGYLDNNGSQQHMRQAVVPMHGHMSSQKMSNANYNGSEQYGQIEVTNKGNKNHGSNNNGSGTKSTSKQIYNNDESYGNMKSSKQAYSNDDAYGNKSKKEMYNNDDGYGSKTSKQMHSNDDAYGNKSKKDMYNNDDGYGSKTSKQMHSNDDAYGNKSKKDMYNNDDGYGSMTSKKMYNNDDSYSNKSSGNTTYAVATKHGNVKQQQQRYTNDDSSSDDDEDEYGNGKGGGKWGTKPLLKQSKSDTYSHGKKFDNVMGSKTGQHDQGITKAQHSQGHGGREQSTRGFDSHVQSYGQQPNHTQFQSQSKSVELKVPICCDNCERKVTACLEYIDGVESVLCDQWQKKVIVYGNVKPDVVLKRVKKVKKASELWQQAKRIPVY